MSSLQIKHSFTATSQGLAFYYLQHPSSCLDAFRIISLPAYKQHSQRFLFHHWTVWTFPGAPGSGPNTTTCHESRLDRLGPSWLNSSAVFSTVWWASSSGRSSSADVWSRTDFLQSDSLWKAFWEQSACQHNNRREQIQHKGKEWEQRPSLEQQHERRDEKINAEEKDFILFIVLSAHFVMSVGCLRLWQGGAAEHMICQHGSSDAKGRCCIF